MRRSEIRDYRDLVAWQEAIELALECDVVCDALPRKHWTLASQIRRAANSVHSNIAEGKGRPSTADYLRHLGISKSSLNEVENDLHFVSRKFPNIDGLRPAQERVPRVARPLMGLIKAIKRKMDQK